MTVIYAIISAVLLLPLLFAGASAHGTELPVRVEPARNCARNPNEDSEF